MNDVVLVENDVYQRYEDLLIRKDVLKKEAVQYEIGYIREFGELIAKRALDKGVSKVVFDRGGFIYQGKVAALADAARKAGLDF